MSECRLRRKFFFSASSLLIISVFIHGQISNLKSYLMTASTSFLRLSCWTKKRKSGGLSPSLPFYLKVSLSSWRIAILRQTIVSQLDL